MKSNPPPLPTNPTQRMGSEVDDTAHSVHEEVKEDRKDEQVGDDDDAVEY
jgi:hypothetical protein